MIGHIRGVVMSLHGGRAIVSPEHGDIGYIIILPMNQIYRERESTSFYIWHAISQDDQKLFGFETAADRWLAELIATTHRIGPTVAHKAVTTLGHDGLVALIRSGDEAKLSKAVKGLGAKGASSIIANLKGKLGDIVTEQDARILSVRNGLRVIGLEVDDELQGIVASVCKLHPEADTAGILNKVLAQRRT